MSSLLPKSPPTETPQSSSRILIAEDDLATNDLLRIQMHLAGLDVDFASDGAGALALYEAAREQGRAYSLLVLDVMMPVSSGLAVAETVRAGGDRGVQIIFLTADDSPFSHARADSVNPVCYLVKPLALIGLPDRLRQVLAAEFTC